VLFLLGADEIDTSASKAFTIYLGTHGDRGAHNADVVLPARPYTEKNGFYRQHRGPGAAGRPFGLPKGEAREDWRSCARSPNAWVPKLPYDTLDQYAQSLFADHPTFAASTMWPGGATRARPGRAAAEGEASPLTPSSARWKLLPDQSDRAGQRDHGRVRRPGFGAPPKIAAE